MSRDPRALLVFFTSRRSGPARRMESLLAHIARKERKTLRVKKVDVDERPDIAERFHVAISNGRVVYQGENPVKDDGPALQAIDRLLKIQERRARLIGLDAPVKHEVRNELRTRRNDPSNSPSRERPESTSGERGE